jgi:hypothetical protein
MRRFLVIYVVRNEKFVMTTFVNNTKPGNLLAKLIRWATHTILEGSFWNMKCKLELPKTTILGNTQ